MSKIVAIHKMSEEIDKQFQECFDNDDFPIKEKPEINEKTDGKIFIETRGRKFCIKESDLDELIEIDGHKKNYDPELDYCIEFISILENIEILHSCDKEEGVKYEWKYWH